MRHIVVILAILLISISCSVVQIQDPVPREVVITFHNDSKLVKTFWFYWMNHPDGCFPDPFRGRMICKATQMVAETQPGSKHENVVKENFENPKYREINGRKYCVEWENTRYDLRDDGSAREYCFEIEEDTISVYITPDGVTIEK